MLPLAALVVFGGLGLGALLALIVRHVEPVAQYGTAGTRPATPGAAAGGRWRIDEANAQVGTIVWVGNAVVRDGEMTFDLHKESVAGRAAVECERETNLHVVLNADRAPQTVPFQEANCDGRDSGGQMRVSSLPSTRSFRGSFWDGTTKLGDFEAHEQ